MLTIHLDMDGVLVDWNRGYKEAVLKYHPYYIEKYNLKEKEFIEMDPWEFEQNILMNFYLKKFEFNSKKAKNAAKGAFWKPIHGSLSFWTNLVWMEDGKELLSYLVNLKNNQRINTLNILSSPSNDPVCELGKREWLRNNAVDHVFDRIIIEQNKSKYANNNKNNILIDDTPKKVDGFISHGGTAILHKNARQTIEKLNFIIQ